MENFLTCIENYLVVLVVLACLCVGFIIKHLIPGDKINKFIPLIMALLGVFLNVWINSWAFSPVILLGGLLSGLASTGLHQVFKQFIESDIGDIIKGILRGGRT
ncbi:MAG: holin [Clostridia bacterium]|nr:holin [Clostridia bacterium]